MAECGSEADFKSLEEVFKDCCNIGVTAKQTQKKTISTSNVAKWFKNCQINGKALSTGIVDNAFMKAKTDKKVRELTFKEFQGLVKGVAKEYKTDKKLADENAAVEKMIKSLEKGIDAKAGTTKTSKTGGVEKQTDTSKYTGSHKERFDESGKGKGAAGREDKADNSGYVGNYKGEGTYDKK